MNADSNESFRAEISALFDKMKTERDEINLQLHLGKAEARDEWENMEEKWEQFRAKAEVVGDIAADASKDVGAATRILGEELKNGYARIREAIAAQK